MVASTASAGYGVVAAKGLIPASNNTLVGNISGATAFPVNVAIADVLAAAGTPSYQGTWNASTNSPALVSSVGTNGNYYVVSTAGTTNLNGITDWSVGDWAIYNGTAVAWQKIEGGATTMTVGSTAIASGTTGRVLYDNAGVLGEMTTTGSGTVLALATSPALVTPALGVATGTSLALGGATLGSNVFAAVGTAILTGATTTSPDWEVWVSGDTFARASLGVNTTDVPRFSMGPGNAARDVFIERAGAANLRLGAPDAAVAIAQTLSVQNVVAGTSNADGANWTFNGSQSTGNHQGGSIIFQTATAGSSGTSVNALAPALTLAGNKLATFTGNILLTSTGGDSGIYTGSTAGTSVFQAAASVSSGASGPLFLLRGVTYSQNANQRGNVYIGAGNPSTPGARRLDHFFTGADVTRMFIGNLGNVVVGSAAIATNATDGFLYIPTCAGRLRHAHHVHRPHRHDLRHDQPPVLVLRQRMEAAQDARRRRHRYLAVGDQHGHHLRLDVQSGRDPKQDGFGRCGYRGAMDAYCE
jgi:hypothetical protein